MVEEERHVVVGVQPGRDDDPEVHLLGDAGDARDVPPQPDDGRVDDGPDAERGHLVELVDGVGDALVLAAPLLRVVLLHVRGEREDVLVHEDLAEVLGVDGSGGGLDLRHGCSFVLEGPPIVPQRS